MNERYLAVFDVGKTNKKFTVFDSELNPVYSTSTRIEEKKKGDIVYDDVEKISTWIFSVLDSALKKYDLGSVVFTTFGATVVLLDRENNLAFPVVSYNQEIEPSLREKFFKEFGSPEELYVRTGTPPLGQLLNVGLQLYWIKNKFPEVYEKTKTILFLPEYFSFILTKTKSTEITSVGCHTYLYDIIDRDWSTVAKRLNVPEKSPPFYNVWDCIGEYKGTKVAAGIHDSNASLVPFLLTEKDEFLLASTGTWCVFMYPGAEYSPSKEDVYRDILYYIDVYGRPVKSARFKCGYEFEYYTNIIRKKFNIDPLKIPFDEELAVKIIKDKTAYVIPTLTPGTGQFPYSKGRIVKEKEFFRDPATAYHVLNLSLATQTYFALNILTRGKKKIRILVQGGFAKNLHYLKYLATLMPYNTIVYYKYTEATSLGAALVGKATLEDKSLKDLDIELLQLESIEVKRLSIDDKYVEEYLESFKELCEKSSI